MAKKNKERIILENVELKPQVIGYTYQKKSNIGRVIFIFIIFALAVFYINDISTFINDLLGKNTAPSIKENTESNKPNNSNKNEEENEVVYNIFSDTLEITESGITLNSFSLSNNILTFSATNNSDTTIDLSNRKYFVEIYSENKTLLERHKLDLGNFLSKNKVNYTFDVKNNFYYLVIEEKKVEDYPNVFVAKDENGLEIITCTKGIEEIIYNFTNNELIDIKHTISDSNVNSDSYYANYSVTQNKVTTYNNIEGISATFNGTLNGYTAIFAIDLAKTDLSKTNEKYYYGYKTLAKEVNFEMQTYGFECK